VESALEIVGDPRNDSPGRERLLELLSRRLEQYRQGIPVRGR